MRLISYLVALCAMFGMSGTAMAAVQIKLVGTFQRLDASQAALPGRVIDPTKRIELTATFTEPGYHHVKEDGGPGEYSHIYASAVELWVNGSLAPVSSFLVGIHLFDDRNPGHPTHFSGSNSGREVSGPAYLGYMYGFTFSQPVALNRFPDLSALQSSLVSAQIRETTEVGGGRGFAEYSDFVFESLTLIGDPASVPYVSEVPEPASWALMLLGFGAIGATLRRRGAAPRPAHA